MDLRTATGYLAHALLAGYWIWVLSSTAPELRRGTRDRALRLRILLVKTAGIALTALAVGVIHFWATHVWHVLVAVPVAVLAGIALRRVYRRLVAAPRHRMPLAQRVRRTGHFDVITQTHGRHLAHRTQAAVPVAVSVAVPASVPASVPADVPVAPVIPMTVPAATVTVPVPTAASTVPVPVPRPAPDAVTSPLPAAFHSSST